MAGMSLPSDPRGAARFLGPLAIRDYALLWSGGLLSRIGNLAFVTGLSYYLYRETGSASAVSILVIAFSIPGVLFASGAGVIADRWDRKRQMVVVNLFQAVVMVVAVAIAADRLWLAYVVMFFDASAGHFYHPAGEAALPSVVPRDQLVRAYSLDSSASSIAVITGPVIGGIAFALGGIGAVALVNCASFVAAAALIMPIRLSARASHAVTDDQTVMADEGPVAAFREGIRHIRTTTGLFGALRLTAVALTAGAVFNTILVPFTNDLLRGGSSEAVGLVLGARGAGGLVAGLVIGMVRRGIRPETMLVVGLSVLAVGLFAAGIAPAPVAVAMVVASGIPDVAWRTSNMTIVQFFTRSEFKGRVFGVYHGTRALSQVLGALVVLVIGDRFGLSVTVATAGALLAVAAFLAFRNRTTARAARAGVDEKLLSEPEKTTPPDI
jgi:predicted MFS family arabinose efflux permease